MDKDVLIIGQGLAGTVLAFNLIDAGLSVDIADDDHASASSMVGIAVINPITGRRYAKSWNIDTLLPLAQETYARIANRIGSQYLFPAQVLQVLPDARVEEVWMMRAGDPEFQPYLDREISTLSIEGLKELHVAQILNTQHLHVNRLLRDSRKWFAEQRMVISTDVDIESLTIGDGTVKFNDHSYRYVVFCDGHRVIQNAFFRHLEIYPMKGEYLICRIPDLDLTAHVKAGISLIPLFGQDLYWCGATYDRYVMDPKPTNAGREFLVKQLGQILTAQYTVEHHGTGIRATTRDRRPYVGSHATYRHVYTISGLGTKGASLAPYCARILSAHLIRNENIPHEVDIFRHSLR